MGEGGAAELSESQDAPVSGVLSCDDIRAVSRGISSVQPDGLGVISHRQ